MVSASRNSSAESSVPFTSNGGEGIDSHVPVNYCHISIDLRKPCGSFSKIVSSLAVEISEFMEISEFEVGNGMYWW